MKKGRWLIAALAVCLLTGCASMLERTYSTVEPHSSKFWESEAVGTLRAENYQDVVNDLLLLISQHTETATLRLYNFKDDISANDTLERAAAEILQETPLGSYAVEYITSTSQSQRGYYEVAVQISYRRTAEQIQTLVNATSPEAVYALLETALKEGKTELAVRVGYWGAAGREQVETAMSQLREDQKLTESKPWLVYYYPAEGSVGLLEFLLDPSEELLAAELPKEEPPAEESSAEGTEEGVPAEGEAGEPNGEPAETGESDETADGELTETPADETESEKENQEN